MTTKDSLGDRMKAYEACHDQYLPRRLPVVVRLDGRAFHTYVRRIGLAKPFDERLMVAMSNTMHRLMEDMENSVLGITQSDEISIVMVDDRGLETQPWFGNRLQKIVSMAASMCTLEFDRQIKLQGSVLGPTQLNLVVPAFFDARVFTVPHSDVANYLLWRQRDGARNCVLGYAQHHLGHSACQGNDVPTLTALLQGEGVLVSELPAWQRNGVISRRLITGLGLEMRGEVVTDRGPPIISHDRAYVEGPLAHLNMPSPLKLGDA